MSMSAPEAPGQPLSPVGSTDYDKTKQAIDLLQPQLEGGLARVTLAATGEDLVLRDTWCGPVSLAIAEALNQQGIGTVAMEAELSKLKTQYPAIAWGHVIAVHPGEDPIIIDGTFGQFFKAFGLDHLLAKDLLADPYPPERILVFPASQTTEVAADLADVACSFWEAYSDTEQFAQRWQTSLRQPMPAVSKPELMEFFGEVYDLTRYHTYEPHGLALKTAKEIIATDPTRSG